MPKKISLGSAIKNLHSGGQDEGLNGLLQKFRFPKLRLSQNPTAALVFRNEGGQKPGHTSARANIEGRGGQPPLVGQFPHINDVSFDEIFRQSLPSQVLDFVFSQNKVPKLGNSCLSFCRQLRPS